MNREQKIAVTECIPVIQGEGKFTGHPSFLIRTSGCNLNCQFKGSLCDASKESWNHNNNTNKLFSLDEIDSVIKRYPYIRKVFITGGNPTTNAKMFLNIVQVCRENGLEIHIEDNGTQYSEKFTKDKIDFISLSPKLRNSIPKAGTFAEEIGRYVTEADVKTHLKNYRNIESLKSWIQNFDYQLKFVVSDEEELQEIEELINEIGADRSKVYLMPEGSKRTHLESRRKWVYETCLKLGYIYTDRLHILVYDDKKGV
jgi:7-carboxy-7-deazaguanine synthase